MDFLETMIARNARFAETAFAPELKILPSAGTIVVGCVDPRVDPAYVLGLEQGEVAVIRNVGGRITPALLETLAVLRVVAKAAGSEAGLRSLVLLHHTDCGIIGCYHHAPELLATYLGVDVAALDDLAILDPYKAVARDVAALKASHQFPPALAISGLVYDVITGRVTTTVPPAALHSSGK